MHMALIKQGELNTDFRNQIKTSVTLHQGNNRDGSDPVNVTNSWSGSSIAFFWLCGSRST